MHSTSWLATLPELARRQLFTAGKRRQLQCGEALFYRGDAFDGIYILEQGLLLISGVSLQGEEALLTVLGPQAVLGEIALFDNQARTHDAIAAQACQLLHLSGGALTDLLQQEPLWWQRFGQLLTSKIREAFVALEQLQTLSGSERLAYRLYQLTSPEQLRVPLSQQQLAQLAGLSRQTTNSILRQWQQLGWLELCYGYLHLLQREPFANNSILKLSGN